jgi:hypothetical protein
MTGYAIGKSNTFYSTHSPDIEAVYGHINTYKVNGVVDFFERTLGAERK